MTATVCLGGPLLAVPLLMPGMEPARPQARGVTLLSAAVVALAYKQLWQVESDNKLDKSCHSLDQLGARTGPAACALVHASMVSSMLVGLLAHHHRRREAPPARVNTERVTAPIHPQSLARAMGSAAQSLAGTLDLTGAEADRRWGELAAHLTHLGKDPNWHNGPSILDQLRGWRITPGRPRKARTASLVRVQAAGGSS